MEGPRTGHTAVSGHGPTARRAVSAQAGYFRKPPRSPPERRYGTEPREGGKDIRREGGGERGGRQVRRLPPPPRLAPPVPSLPPSPPPIPTRKRLDMEDQTVD